MNHSMGMVMPFLWVILDLQRGWEKGWTVWSQRRILHTPYIRGILCVWWRTHNNISSSTSLSFVVLGTAVFWWETFIIVEGLSSPEYICCHHWLPGTLYTCSLSCQNRVQCFSEWMLLTMVFADAIARSYGVYVYNVSGLSAFTELNMYIKS